MKPSIPALDIDGYINEQPESIREQLEQLRKIIISAAPNAKEVISYSMPAFKMKKVLVYFAGYKNHIGFYPTGTGIKSAQAPREALLATTTHGRPAQAPGEIHHNGGHRGILPVTEARPHVRTPT